MKSAEISRVQHKQLLSHPSAKDTGCGWIVCADRNCFNAVILVSKHRAYVHSFEYGEPYHSYLRAQIAADFYAGNNPENASSGVFQVLTHALLAA